MLRRPTSCQDTLKKREMKQSPKYKRKKFGLEKLEKSQFKRKLYKVTNFISVKDSKFWNSSKFKNYCYIDSLEQLCQKIKKSKKYNNIRIVENTEMIKISNRMENNFHISNKKCLFYNMQQLFAYKGEDMF